MSPQTPVDTEDVQPAPNIDHLLSNIGRTALLGEASGENHLNLMLLFIPLFVILRKENIKNS